MTLRERIKQNILKFLGLNNLNENPNGDRLTFLGDPETIKDRKIEEYKVWYYGNSDELLNFYTAMGTYGNNKNPIYNRNKENYFWGISSDEAKIKRIHSGLPYAIVSTLTNVVGMPNITSRDRQEQIDKIIDRTKLVNIINQKQMPMTLALGWGAFKPIIDKQVCSDSPLVEWYNADDVEFVVKHDVVIGILYTDYYKYDGKDYVLIETRRVKDGDSIIEYQLFRYEKDNSVVQVELDTIPELSDLSKDGLVIKGLNRVMGVPSVFFYDMNNANYGRSIFEGKIDMFDDLDQDVSIAGMICRMSTPITYYPADMLDRGKDGRPQFPDTYNRQFIKNDSYPNGDGEMSGQIVIDQPQVSFTQYSDKILNGINMILTGTLSPATLGLNIAKDDTALSQREKEKITIQTRNNIIDRQTIIIKNLLNLMLVLDEFMQKGYIENTDYDLSVKFTEFANPTFEQKSNTLVSMLSNGGISPELYVEKLYGDSLSKEEKLKEVEYIIEQQQKDDNLDLSEFENEGTIAGNSNVEGKEQESTELNEQDLLDNDL